MSYRQLPLSPLAGSARGEVQEDFSFLVSWRRHAIAAIRIAFGSVWVVNAWWAWQPAFRDNLIGYATKALYAQPQGGVVWLNAWLHVISLNPRLFAFAITTAETGIAVGLLLGILSNLTCLGGVVLSLCLWSLASGSGYPYAVGATDSGIALLYILFFVGLLLAHAGSFFGVDHYLDGTPEH